MSMAVGYLRVGADHIELLQKDPIDALYDLNPNLNAYCPDRNAAVGLILQNLPGDIEELNMNDTTWFQATLKLGVACGWVPAKQRLRIRLYLHHGGAYRRYDENPRGRSRGPLHHRSIDRERIGRHRRDADELFGPVEQRREAWTRRLDRELVNPIDPSRCAAHHIGH